MTEREPPSATYSLTLRKSPAALIPLIFSSSVLNYLLLPVSITAPSPRLAITMYVIISESPFQQVRLRIPQGVIPASSPASACRYYPGVSARQHSAVESIRYSSASPSPGLSITGASARCESLRSIGSQFQGRLSQWQNLCQQGWSSTARAVSQLT